MNLYYATFIANNKDCHERVWGKDRKDARLKIWSKYKNQITSIQIKQ